MHIKHFTNIAIFIVISLSALLFGCANYSVSTNLDKKNFTQYFAASNVNVYASEQQLPTFHHYVGMVTGESCQAKASAAPANKGEARTNARKKANNLKANAVIFTSCITTKTKQCDQLLICYAKAYHVNN